MNLIEAVEKQFPSVVQRIREQEREACARECPACAERRRHMADDWKNHPDAGTGHSNEAGQPLGKERK